jgi:triacylglycerol lipase
MELLSPAHLNTVKWLAVQIRRRTAHRAHATNEPSTKSFGRAPMKKTLIAIAGTLFAGICSASSQSYYQCTPAGCVVEGTASVVSTSNATQYPIVLAHGLFGTGQYFDLLDYWYNIPQGMAANGAKVYVTTVSAANSTALRGEQLLAQVQTIVAISGKPKVNLIGHSHGGPTSRYVAGVAPQLVASVTAIASPNKGTPLMDVIQSVTSAIGPTATGVVANGFNAFAKRINSSQPQDILAAVQDTSTKGSLAFNQKFPGGVPATACGQGDASYKGVRYYSWSGDSSATANITNPLDPIDALTTITGLAFAGQPGDGLVGTCSSHLGVVIRDNYYQNHFDEVNQALGLISLFTTYPPTLFKNHANRLKNEGL